MRRVDDPKTGQMRGRIPLSVAAASFEAFEQMAKAASRRDRSGRRRARGAPRRGVTVGSGRPDPL
jgi:hypothetical protein